MLSIHTRSWASLVNAQVEDDSLLDAEEIPETGYVDEQGELRRPWCRETRILEHRWGCLEVSPLQRKQLAEGERLVLD